MTKHVDHLLAAYVEQQLDVTRARAVYQHIQECAACRSRLARHEMLVRDIRASIQSRATSSPAQIGRWWSSIKMASTSAVRRQTFPVLIPVAMILLVVLFPVTVGLTSLLPWQPANPALVLTSTAVEGAPLVHTALAIALIPQPESRLVDRPLVGTPAPQTSIPLAPAPLAPSEP